MDCAGIGVAELHPPASALQRLSPGTLASRAAQFHCRQDCASVSAVVDDSAQPLRALATRQTQVHAVAVETRFSAPSSVVANVRLVQAQGSARRRFLTSEYQTLRSH